ncbi:Pof6 interactor protein 1 [Cyphellophora attinorum]|uniref:Pof6 interactor protein 1 n=1 Tax=Cyphellophora attinorum TaxID=1664694 RepID=A0A0N1HVZ3_9EURO|nr:Pof6 interactor protein 1 [Phialophora attinorum]KPI41616.1 Pof6 interactor protein 1 [Phialophora attinorum]
MSTNGAPSEDATPPTTSLPELDVSKLHALPTEQQDLYLLSFVADLRDAVASLSAEALPARQAAVKKEVIKIVGLATPVPSRVIRNGLATILADTFARGSRSLLFETINDLVTVLGASKIDKDWGPKHVAVVCMGSVYEAAGDSAPRRLRASVFRALGQVVKGTNRGLDETTARDIWKAARSAAGGDKAILVQRDAFDCLWALLTSTSFFGNSTDFDRVENLVWKAFDSPVPALRYAAARVLSSVLTAAHSETNNVDVPVVRKPKKSSKKQGPLSDDNEDPVRPGSPAPIGKGAVALSFTLRDMVKLLSTHFVRLSNHGKAGICLCMKMILAGLPVTVVEDNFGRIAESLIAETVDHPSMGFNRHRALLTRKLIHEVLQSRIASLTENTQINTVRYLINSTLKDYPKVVAERREPSKRVLTATLELLYTLLKSLGSAVAILQDSCRDALCQVMQHPSHTVQSYGAQCFKAFVLCCPVQLIPTIEILVDRLRKALETPAENRQSLRACTGYALSVAAMLHSANSKPVFGSVRLYSDVLTFAQELLKKSATAELRLSATQLQVAWTLLGGLMNLGPSFIKVHLGQLLLLWRNALPPPLTPDNAAQRSQLELSFLCHVRECALSGLLSFIEPCGVLITTDGTRRIAAMLQNTVNFLAIIPASRSSSELSHRLVPALQLQDMTIMLRRRVLQCYAALIGLKNVEISDVLAQSDVVGLSLQAFTSPQRSSSGSSLEVSLTTSASNFDGLWESGDNWAHGVSSLMAGLEISYPSAKGFSPRPTTMMSSEEQDTLLERLPAQPSLPALEHDSAILFRLEQQSDAVETVGPSTACVDAGIKLFSMVYSSQSSRVQESSMEQLAAVVNQTSREPGRKAALTVNSTLAILMALSISNGDTSFSTGQIHLHSIGKTLGDVLRSRLGDPDYRVRAAAARALGIACNLGGTQFTNNEVKALIDRIVADRDPHLRAGCALALGSIHSEVGAMASSLHIKSIISVLLSLCNDSHPVVHFWALRGLTQVAESAGLSFSAYAASTLGMLAQLYSNDNHNLESGSQSTSALELEFSTPLAIGQNIESIVNVLGPDLQDVSKPRQMILTLLRYFEKETSPKLRQQSLVCFGHLYMYAPAHVQFAQYVHDLERDLVAQDPWLASTALSGISNLIKRNANEVTRVASSKLNDDLWALVDQDCSNLVPQSTLRSWMQQTMMSGPGDWVERCQNILSRTRVTEKNLKRANTVKTATSMPDLADEEVAGFAAAVQGDAPDAAAENQDFLHWQTRNFAMELLSESLQLVQAAMSPDHSIPAEEELYGKISDIIRIAFSASTANVVELRVWGLRIIDQVLKMFGKTPDPDFLEASLLEQYQAQIGSALTPAFAADSSPELAAEAIAVCATFAATGIVTTADRMGRIFKVLANGVDNLASPDPEPSIGDLKNLTPNAQSLLKMALLTSWAQLQLASIEQSYLEEIVRPYITKLAPLWVNALQEFARLRFEPEISDTLGIDTSAPDLDERYAAFNRVVRLSFYQGSWLSIVNAISVSVEKDSDAVFGALDNKRTSQHGANGDVGAGKDMSFREEPVAFFFILFGLAFESLVTRGREDPSQALLILQALRKILTPSVSGSAIYQEAVFNETTDTLDRLALTSTTSTQSTLIDIARNLSLDHPSAKAAHDRDEKLSDDIEQLFELTRIMVLVLPGLIPTLEDPPGQAIRKLQAENISLVQSSFSALVEVAEVFPAIIRADLHACIFYCYCTMLATGICQEEVMPALLSSFRDFLQIVTKPGQKASALVRGCLSQILVTLSIAQRRENDFSLTAAKNCLLSVTVILTTAGGTITGNDRLIGQAVAEIMDCLQDVGLAKIAVNCIRTLLQASKTACDEAASRMLWPQLITFVCDQDREDPETVRPIILHGLVTSVPTLPVGQRQPALAILVTVLLHRAENIPVGEKKSAVTKEVASRLLELVSADPIGFRATVALLDDARRALLENLLRSTDSGRRHSAQGLEDTAESKAPAIELRLDF